MCFSKWKVRMFQNDIFWTKNTCHFEDSPDHLNRIFHVFFNFFSFKYIFSLLQICLGFLVFYTGWTFSRKFRVMAENRKLRKQSKLSHLSRLIKIIIYKSWFAAVLLYGSETWVLTIRWKENYLLLVEDIYNFELYSHFLVTK
jgi:hypothetical protein